MHKAKPYIKFIALIILFVAAVWFANYIKDNDFVQMLAERFGYAGVFILALVSGFNVFVPIPAISFLPIFIEVGMDTVIVVVIVSLGMACGDGVGYLLGRYGREVVGKQSWPQWLQKTERFLSQKTYGVSVFLFLYASFVPFPNELVVIPAAATGQKPVPVLAPIFFGNILHNTIIAFGISSIFV